MFFSIKAARLVPGPGEPRELCESSLVPEPEDVTDLRDNACHEDRPEARYGGECLGEGLELARDDGVGFLYLGPKELHVLKGKTEGHIHGVLHLGVEAIGTLRRGLDGLGRLTRVLEPIVAVLEDEGSQVFNALRGDFFGCKLFEDGGGCFPKTLLNGFDCLYEEN